MADIFTKQHAFSLLKNKFILFMGDSNMRGLYKDLLFLLQSNTVIPAKFLCGVHKDKGISFLGDRILLLPPPFPVNAGRDYFEEREYKTKNLHLRFHFVTKAYGKEMVRTLEAIQTGRIPTPDCMIINSCVWDLTRWGPQNENNYKHDLVSLFSHLRTAMPRDSLVIWNSTAPISVKRTKGGVLVKQLEFVRYSLRFMILEANKFTQLLCMSFGFDFIDIHYHMRYQLQSRSIDGIHWEPQAIRFILCIILTHISLALEKPLPGIVKDKYIQRCIDSAVELTEIKLPSPCYDAEIEKRVKQELEIITRREEGKQRQTQTQSRNSEELVKPQDRVKLSARRRGSERNSKIHNRENDKIGTAEHVQLWMEDLRNQIVHQRHNNANLSERVNTGKSSLQTGFELIGLKDGRTTFNRRNYDCGPSNQLQDGRTTDFNRSNYDCGQSNSFQNGRTTFNRSIYDCRSSNRLQNGRTTDFNRCNYDCRPSNRLILNQQTPIVPSFNNARINFNFASDPVWSEPYFDHRSSSSNHSEDSNSNDSNKGYCIQNLANPLNGSDLVNYFTRPYSPLIYGRNNFSNNPPTPFSQFRF